MYTVTFFLYNIIEKNKTDVIKRMGKEGHLGKETNSRAGPSGQAGSTVRGTE